MKRGKSQAATSLRLDLSINTAPKATKPPPSWWGWGTGVQGSISPRPGRRTEGRKRGRRWLSTELGARSSVTVRGAR